MTNPWNLTESQSKAVVAFVEHGSEKSAAYALGISDKTVNQHLTAVRERMNVRSRIHMVLQWDRWKRAQELLSYPVEQAVGDRADAILLANLQRVLGRAFA